MTPTNMIREGIFDPDEYEEEEHTSEHHVTNEENRVWLENQKV